MHAQVVDYLAEWERAQLEVESPELKRATEQRQRQVVQHLTELESLLRNANNSVAPLLTQLEDIDRVTGNDPTAAGIAGVKKSGIVATAQKRATSARYRLDVAGSRYDRVLASLSPQPGTRPLTAAAPPPSGAAGAAPSAAAMPPFPQADRDGSGAIEPQEAMALPGFDFAAADRDKDGKLSGTEYDAIAKPGGAGTR